MPGFPNLPSIDETVELASTLGRSQKPVRSACLLVVSGSLSGRIFRLGNACLLGRDAQASICLEDEGISRYHARIDADEHGTYTLVDCDSRNGTYCNGQTVQSCLLVDGDLIGIGRRTVLKFAYQDATEEQLLRQQYDFATRDALTGAFNRRYFMDNLEREFGHARRGAAFLALVLIDLDHFKQLNDTHGHPAGDSALRHVAGILHHVIRQSEIVARYGGEEFIALLRDTSTAVAMATAERWRIVLCESPVALPAGPVSVTASFGVASTEGGQANSPETLLAAADVQLYRAKALGRNRVMG